MAQKNLKSSDEGKISFPRKFIFIENPKALKMFKKLEDFKNNPNRNKMDLMFIVGDTGIGKTTMLKKFYEMNIYRNDREMLFFEHVMLIQPSNKTSLHDLYNRMFHFFFVPYNKNASINEKEKKLMHYCEVNEVEMIIIDEIQRVLIGNLGKQRKFINGIKKFSNFLKIPIVLVGTPSSLNFMKMDCRLRKNIIPIKIKKWEYNEEYLSFLQTIETTFSSEKPLNIYKNENLAKKILKLSDGTTEHIIKICKIIIVKTIENKEEEVSEKIIENFDCISKFKAKDTIYADEI